MSVNHNSRCAEWLFENSESKFNIIFFDCKFDNILETYNFRKQFSEKYDLPFKTTKIKIIVEYYQ
jgi:3'-phosphoadenosine 5'-phosphosulfate sulfotransferase (PAPS reductase)/FAD synthetase